MSLQRTPAGHRVLLRDSDRVVVTKIGRFFITQNQRFGHVKDVIGYVEEYQFRGHRHTFEECYRFVDQCVAEVTEDSPDDRRYAHQGGPCDDCERSNGPGSRCTCGDPVNDDDDDDDAIVSFINEAIDAGHGDLVTLGRSALSGDQTARTEVTDRIREMMADR